MRKSICWLGLLVAPAIALAGCGSSDAPDAQSPSASASVAANAADVMFAQMMIPHHEQAIEMSDLALEPRAEASPEVKSLATQVKAAQGPEIKQLQQWLAEWGAPESAGHMGHEMNGMMDDEDMTELAGISGAEFGKRWLEMMIVHHEGAVEMSQEVLEDGDNPQVAAMAQAIIDGQNKEIELMKSYLQG